jgi:hypothetical protein
VPSPPSTMLCGGGGRSNTLSVLKSHWRLGIYAVLLMTAFNFFGHGTQGLYPIFVQVQHGFAPHEVGLIAVSYNIGRSSAASRLARCPRGSDGGTGLRACGASFVDPKRQEWRTPPRRTEFMEAAVKDS